MKPSGEEIKHEDSVRSHYVKTPYHERPSLVDVEKKQREMHASHDNSQNTNNGSARKLYLIDENAYRSSALGEAVTEMTQSFHAVYYVR